MESTNDLYKISSAAIDSAALDLRDLSDVLWKNPELAFNEFKVLQRPGTYLLGTDNLISLFFEKNFFCKGAKTSKKFEIFSSFSGGYKALQITQKLTCTRHVDLLQAKLCIKCKL